MGLIEMSHTAFFDVAGTIVAGNPWTYVFDHASVNRRRVNLAYVPTTFWWTLKKLRVIDDTRFRHHWLWSVAGVFRGWRREQLQTLFADALAVSRAAGDFFNDTAERITWHKEQGHHVVLISGMFDLYIDEYVRAVGADAGIGSVLGFDANGVCTGRIAGDTIGGETKLHAMQRYLAHEELSTDPQTHYAYADSYSDVPMLSAVAQPCAVHPEPELAEFAKAHGWPILGNLTTNK